ncbi:acyl-CoA synthetase [compost metagenome]
MHSVAAFSIPGAQGESAVVLVELRGGDREQLAARVREQCSRRVGLVPLVVVVDPHSIPRTTSGKPQRQEARRRYLAWKESNVSALQ